MNFNKLTYIISTTFLVLGLLIHLNTQPAKVVTHIVERGASLSSIAQAYYPSQDTRYIIEVIQSNNKLRSDVIQPGQKLELEGIECLKI